MFRQFLMIFCLRQFKYIEDGFKYTSIKKKKIINEIISQLNYLSIFTSCSFLINSTTKNPF